MTVTCECEHNADALGRSVLGGGTSCVYVDRLKSATGENGVFHFSSSFSSSSSSH